MIHILTRITGKLHRVMGSLLNKMSTPGVSIWRTLYVNFYFLPFRKACSLPIYIYGKLNFLKCYGHIEIDCDKSLIHRGMIKINANVESPGVPGGDSVISIGENCKIIFEGSALIAHNTKILLWGESIFTIGANSVLGLGSDISCSKHILFHNDVRLGANVKIYDTNFHYTFKNDLVVHQCNAPIELGHHCWIGTRVTIMKGVKLPAYTTVASNSVVNKNVTENERSLIGGIPAKLLLEGYSRVFNRSEEGRIYDFFKKNPQCNNFQLNKQLDLYD